jgi:phage shock protein PspC (stress-responsive transcriptional regulator)
VELDHSKGIQMSTLARPANDRMIAGVCSAIGHRFGISPNIVRLLFLLSMLLPGPQILIYLAGWILIPNERRY